MGIWKWLGVLEWPSWLVIAANLIGSVILMLLALIAHQLLTPVAAKVSSSVGQAGRALVALVTALVAAPMPETHYVMATDTVSIRVTTGSVTAQLGPLTVSACGTVTNPPA